MSIDSRLKGLAPALSAQERAILVLRAWNEERPEDPSWRRTMPAEQVDAFNRYIGLMNVAHRELSIAIKSLHQATETVALRQAWLVSLVLWQEHVDEIRLAIRLAVREPIGASEYAAKVEANRAQWVPVEELAGELANREGVWTGADYEADEEGHQFLTDEAWDRACEVQERWLRKRVTDGTLPGRGKGRNLKVQAGAFDDLIGHESGAVPEDDRHMLYQVMPDSEQVATDRRMLASLQRVLDWKPFNEIDGERDLPNMPGQMIGYLKESTAYQMISTWVQLRTIETVLEEMSAEFEGTHPINPRIRALLDETRETLLKHRAELTFLNVEVELREPLPEELEETREFVRERAAAN